MGKGLEEQLEKARFSKISWKFQDFLGDFLGSI
jgi:hypothetical protein